MSLVFEVLENHSLKHYNTFNLDVKTARYIQLNSTQEVKELLNYACTDDNILILGGGSNLLLLNDFHGLVVHLQTKGIRKIEENSKEAILECEAGEVWDDLVSYSVKNQLYGIENMALIPGTVGASPIQNIGAYGTEIKDVLLSVEGFDVKNQEFITYSNNECHFDYRSSIFKTKLKGKFLITKVRIKLSKKKKYQLNYRALNEKFGNIPTKQITLEAITNYIKKVRNEKLPDHKILGNAGSFFKNPEISLRELTEIKKNFDRIVSFATPVGTYKLAAGWLIEECGFKGKRIGNVSCYTKQALVIVNHGNATGKEIKEYSEMVQNAVKDKFGIFLQPEVNII